MRFGSFSELWPWDVAERLFRPDDEPDYPPAIERVAIWRARLGFFAVVYFSLANGVWPLDEDSILRTVAISIAVVSAWVCVLLCYGAIRQSDELKRGSRRVLLRILTFLGALLAAMLVLQIPFLGVVSLLWVYPFLWWSVFIVYKTQFGAGDAHPALAPISAASITLALAGRNIAGISHSALPPHVDKLIVFSGTATVVLLCSIELITIARASHRLTAEHQTPADESGHQQSAPLEPDRNSLDSQIVRRHRSGRSRRVIAVAAGFGLALTLLWAGSAYLTNRTGAATTHGPPKGPAIGQPSDPAQGTLTIKPRHDYLLAAGEPYFIARAGGADVGHLTGTADGVELADADVLALPRRANGTYQSCLALNWTGPGVWSVGHVIPWRALRLRRQFCVQTTYSGLWISLLTVSRAPARERVTFHVATWSCNARPDESALC